MFFLFSFKMTFCVDSQLNLLRVLADATPKLQKEIIKSADPCLIEAIAEICHNYVCGNIKCNEGHFKKLKKYKKNLRKLSSNTSKREEKRKILLQSGKGFVGFLIAPIISELVSFLIKKSLK